MFSPLRARRVQHVVWQGAQTFSNPAKAMGHDEPPELRMTAADRILSSPTVFNHIEVGLGSRFRTFW